MNLIWGIILVGVPLECWIWQIIIAFSPKVAAKSDILPGINAWALKSRYSCMENCLKRRGFKPITKRVKKAGE